MITKKQYEEAITMKQRKEREHEALVSSGKITFTELIGEPDDEELNKAIEIIAQYHKESPVAVSITEVLKGETTDLQREETRTSTISSAMLLVQRKKYAESVKYCIVGIWNTEGEERIDAVYYPDSNRWEMQFDD